MKALRCRSGRDERRLVLVDVENVAGGTLQTTAMAEWARQVVEDAVKVLPGEQVVVCVGTFDGLFYAKRAWPQARVVLMSGQDGADRALLEVLCKESVGERFGRVAIVSGDGIFAEAAAALGGQGTTVSAYGWRRCMALRLRFAADRVVLLDDPLSSEGEVAA